MTTKPALIHPFAGVVPSADKAHLVATRSYLSYSSEELRDKLSRNPYSYMHVIHPHGTPMPTGSDMGPIRSAFTSYVEKGWLHRDDTSHFYLLRQESEYGGVTGIIALVDTAAAERGDVKAHEATLARRETLFARYLEQVGLNAEPTLLAHRPLPALHAAREAWMQRQPDLDFTTTDTVRHTLWKVPADEGEFTPLLAQISALYIADGHHRVASSQRLAQAHPDHPGAQRFMAMIVDGDQLVFRGYHRRLLHDHGPEEWAATVTAMTALDEVSVLSNSAALPEGSVELTLSGAAHQRLAVRLTPSDLTLPEWLQQRVFAPIFGIHQPRTDRRLRCLTESEHQSTPVPENQLAFVLPPLDFDQLAAAADDGRHMPPKSTWIAPKLRSGLVLYDFGPAT